MSNLTRWEPLREMVSLREAMDRLFDDAFTRPLNVRSVTGMPSLDMYQTDEAVVVKASLPGLRQRGSPALVDGMREALAHFRPYGDQAKEPG